MKKRTAGFSLIELLLVVAIILTIAAIAIPSFLRSRIAANEAAAVSSLRTITTAETSYAQTFPELGYTCTLSEMGPPATGNPPSSSAAGILDPVVASSLKQGYQLSLSNCGTTPRTTYNSDAVPVSQGVTGVRAFCSDASGVIRYSSDGTAATCRGTGSVLQ